MPSPAAVFETVVLAPLARFRLALAVSLFCLAFAACSQTVVDYAVPSLGVVVDADLRVIDVTRNSMAAHAGVQRGDILISLEGLPFADRHDAINALLGSYNEYLQFFRSVSPLYLEDGRPVYPTARLGSGGLLLVVERAGEQVDLVIDIRQPWFDSPLGTPPPTSTPFWNGDLDYF